MSTEGTPTTAPPPATEPPPAADPKPAEKKLLDDLKRAQAKAKELEAKLAEAMPYVEKFKGHEDAKALEVQRAAEARARQDAESRARQELEGKRERAILKALIGVVPQGDSELGEFALWKLSTDPSITYDPEAGTFNGLPEAVAALQASSRFAGSKPGEPARKAAPGLPDTRKDAGGTDPKYAGVKTFADLTAMGLAAVTEYHEKYPDRYAALKAAQRQGLSSPTRVIPPAAMRS